MARYLKALECDVKAEQVKKQLVDAIKGNSDDPKLLMKLSFITFIAVELRDCSSIFSMYHVSPQDIENLKGLAHDYFTAVTLFTGSVSGTVWSIGNLAPVYTWWVFDRYRTGLGLSTMQERQAKHVQIASYARNSLFREHWNQVFRHDFVSKLWLPLQQPSLLTYSVVSSVKGKLTSNPKSSYLRCTALLFLWLF